MKRRPVTPTRPISLKSALFVSVLMSCLISFRSVSWSQSGDRDQTPPPQLTAREWEEDIDSLVFRIPRYHGNEFHAVSRPEFEQAVHTLRSNIGTMNEDQILVGMARLVGMIQDGHNFFDISRGTDRYSCYPLRVGWYPDGVYIEQAAPNAAALAGGRIIAIDHHPIDSIITLVAPLLPHDPGNLPHGFTHLSQYLLDAHILHGLGITHNATEADIAVEKGGTTRDMVLHPSIFPRRSFYFPPPADWSDARPAGIRRPLTWMHRDSTFWLTYLPDQRTLYVQINGVADGDHETLADFSQRIARSVQEDGANRVILDLRWNDGGNNYLLKPLIVALIRMPRIDERGHLIVVTGPTTLSAAQNLVNRLENLTEVLFVGQPTGENVNFYGDTRGFDLPRSKCRVALANLWWQDKDPRDKRTATFPEIALEATFKDFSEGRDPAVDYILSHETIPTIEEILTDALARRGYDGAAGAYRTYRKDPAHRYLQDAIVEGKVNNLGYVFIAQKRLEDAIAVLKMNTEEFPTSFNTWDSLGEAYADAGRKADAIAAYKKSLELNPTSRSGLDALKKLGQ